MNARMVVKNILMLCGAARFRALESARSAAADAWTIAGDLIRELRRLNGASVHSAEHGNAGRRQRAAIVRERLEMRYRHHTPCC